MQLHQFPIVSLSGAGRASFPAEVREGLRTQGFLAVIGHEASPDLMDAAEGQAKELFTRWSPEELEQRYGRPKLFRQRGPSFFAEQAAAQPGEERPPVDSKWFYMLRDEELPEDPADYPFGPNVWPDDLLPEFQPVMRQLTAVYKSTFFTLLDAIERAYGLPSGKLVNMARGSETILRPIFYPGKERLRAMGIEVPEGSQRSAPHGDINALTVLRPRPGLWARLNGSWVKASANDPEVLWVNIGEMLAQMMGIDDLVPTIHCVGTPPGESDPEGDALLDSDRVAIPLFGHFRRSTFLRPGLRVGDWFDQRIREITTG